MQLARRLLARGGADHEAAAGPDAHKPHHQHPHHSERHGASQELTGVVPPLQPRAHVALRVAE